MRFRTVVLVALLFLGVPPRLHADPVTLSGQGTVTQVFCVDCLQRQLGFSAAPGDPFTFSITFSSNRPADAFPNDPTHGAYFFGPGVLRIGLGTGHFLGNSDADISAEVDNNNSFGDQFAFGANRVFTTSQVLGLIVRGVDFQGRFLDSDALPTDIVGALNAAPRREFFVIDPAADFSPYVGGTVLSFSSTPTAPTPEPTTMLLLGTGLAGIAARRWRIAA